MRWAWPIVVTAWWIQSCSSQQCTLVACVSGVQVDLRTEAGTWEDGRYTVSFTTPQRKYECALQLPIDFPSGSQWSKPLPCSGADGTAGRFAGSFDRYTVCELPRSADAKSPECERRAEHFMVRGRFDELVPETLAVEVERDGAAMFKEMRTVRYEEWYPNGPECDREPCRASNVELTMR
jgi:hypothetical protein